MAFLLLLVVVLLLVIISRKNTEIDEAYRRGYNDAKAGREVNTEPVPMPAFMTQNQTAVDVVEQPVYKPQPEKSPAEIEKTRLQNLNTILYMASFMLVAAAAALMAAAVSPVARLIGLIAIVCLFYGAGLALYIKVPRLKPAAVAFVGTGLAILPFVGIALTILGGLTETQAWMAISLVGVVAYVVAALVLQSQVVSYLSLAFVISLASSAVASVQLPIVWYFVVLIMLSLIANVVSFIWPRLLPKVFRQPVENTGQIVTPITLLASLFVGSGAEISTYEIIFGLATAHYLAVWLLKKQYIYEAVIRSLAHVTLLIIGWDLFAESGSVTLGLYWLILLVIQAAYSLTRVTSYASSRRRESVWLATAIALMVFGMTAWIGAESAAGLVCLSLISIIIMSYGAVVRLTNWYWLIVGVTAFVPLVLVAARLWFDPAWAWSTIVGVFSVALIGAATWRYVAGLYDKSRCDVSRYTVALYAAVIIIIGLSVGEMTAFWSCLMVSAVVLAMSYIERQPGIEVGAGVLATIGLAYGIGQSSIDSNWQVLAVCVASAAGLVIGALVHHRRRELDRRDGLLGLAAIAGAALVTNMFVDLEIVRQTSLILLLASALTAYGLRQVIANKSSDLSRIVVAAYFGFAVLGLLVASSLDAGWLSLAFAVAALIAWLGSYSEKQPLLMLAGNGALVATVIFLWSALSLSSTWAAHGQAWLVAAVLYGLYWLVSNRGADRERGQIQLASSLSVLVFLVIITFFSYMTSLELATAGTLVAIAAMIAIDGYRQKDMRYVEAAIYIATFGMQRVAGLLMPEIHPVFYAHWWAVTLLLTAWYLPVIRKVRLMIAMSLITGVVGITALVEGGWYSLLFLIEHLALLLFGALRNIRWALWWGVAASSLAIMYFLRDYVYLWLGFLGLALIGVVIWRLITSESKAS